MTFGRIRAAEMGDMQLDPFEKNLEKSEEGWPIMENVSRKRRKGMVRKEQPIIAGSLSRIPLKFSSTGPSPPKTPSPVHSPHIKRLYRK